LNSGENNDHLPLPGIAIASEDRLKVRRIYEKEKDTEK
jgi:hypothetical protein